MIITEKHRTYVTCIVVLFAFSLLAGCSFNSSAEDSEDKIATTDVNQESDSNDRRDFSGTTLRVAFGLGDKEWEVFEEQIIPAFSLQTGIQVEAIENRTANFVDRLDSEVNANNVTIDLFAIDINNLSGLVSRDLVIDLTKYERVIPETVVQGMVEASTFEERLLFLPFRPNVEITFYNEKMLSTYGLTPPKDWEELLTVAKSLKRQTGEGRLAIKANLEVDNVLHLFDFIRQGGGDPFVLNDEGSIKAFKFLQELYPYLNDQSSTANWDTMNKYLENDSVYIGKNWPFYIPEFHSQDKEEIKSYGGWEGPGGVSNVLGGDVIGIPKGNENVEASILFAKFLMSKPVQEVLAAELSWPAVRYDSYGIIEGYQEPYFQTIKTVLKSAEPRGNKPYWTDAEPIYIEAFNKAIIEGEQVEGVLNQAAEKLRNVRQTYEIQ